MVDTRGRNYLKRCYFPVSQMDHSRLHSHGLGFEKGQVPLVMSFTTTALERTSALDIETSSSAQSTGKHKSPEEGQTTADSAMFARELGLGGVISRFRPC